MTPASRYVTEEITEKAWDAAMDKADSPELLCSTTMIRAALESIALDLVAMGMGEAAGILRDDNPSYYEEEIVLLLARADSLREGVSTAPNSVESQTPGVA